MLELVPAATDGPAALARSLRTFDAKARAFGVRPAQYCADAVDGADEDRARNWRTFAAPVVAVAYGGALAAVSWGSAMDGDDGATSGLLTALTIVGRLALSALCGYLLTTLAFVLIPLAVAVPAFIGERGERFDNELRYFNWLLLVLLNIVLVLPGVVLARRRA